MVSWYPEVVDEWTTLRRVLAGASIARYGDGELKIMRGGNCVSQRFDTQLSNEMAKIIARGSTDKLLVGIPTIDSRNPKMENWQKLTSRFGPLLTRGQTYHSSFITRPDNAPWLGTPDYFDAVESLWKGQRVTFVGNGQRSLTAQFLMDTGAEYVNWIKCSYRDSYAEIGKLFEQVMHGGISEPTTRVLLCVGPTATCLASRLESVGMHAIDLGHIGMFWRRYGQFGTWKEQREINKDTNQVEPNP